MKIASVFIQDIDGFTNFQMDLNYPEGHPRAGEALDRVCFVGTEDGRPGRLMRLLIDYLRGIFRYKSKYLFRVKLQVGDRFVYSVHLRNEVLFFRNEIDDEPEWIVELLRNGAFTLEFNRKYEKYCIGFEEDAELFDTIWLENNSNDALIFQPAEYAKDWTLRISDVPLTKPREVESLRDNFPVYSEVSPERISDFWSLLIHLILQRDKAFKEYCQDKINRSKPSNQLRADFDKLFPNVVSALGKLWNPILKPLGMKLDEDNVEEPISYSDTLKLFVVRKGKGGAKVEYSDMEPGLRKYLFRLGHLMALNLHRKIKTGLCFLETPENNLHPNWQSSLIDRCHKLVQKQQLFVSTASPMIVSQFDPAERLIWGAEGYLPSQLAAEDGLDKILESDFGLK